MAARTERSHDPWLGPAAGLAAMLTSLAVAALLRDSAEEPLRLAASLPQGQAAFAPGPLPPFTSFWAGLVLIISGAGLGQWFLFLCRWFPGLAATPATLIIASAAFGSFLWLVGFSLIGAFIRPWFSQTDPIAYCVAAILGGATLGGLFTLAGIHRPPQLE